MKMRVLISFEKMCAFQAGTGRFCGGSKAMCVEDIVYLFGILIGIRLYIFYMFTQGISSVMKWPVVPELATV